MQIVSHKSRAYCIEKGELQGFLKETSTNIKKLTVIVPILEPWKTRLPFNLKLNSGKVIAEILSFYGNRTEVYRTLQVLNQDGRAYIV